MLHSFIMVYEAKHFMAVVSEIIIHVQDVWDLLYNFIS
jgi:hypothetical protein